jgi:hypothetical protein
MRGDLIVGLAGVGNDRWPNARARVIEGGALLITASEQVESGRLERVTPARAQRLYSAAEWLKVGYYEPEPKRFVEAVEPYSRPVRDVPQA